MREAAPKQQVAEELRYKYKQGPKQWLEALAEDVGGWWGFGLGIVMMLSGAFSGKGIVLASGAILMSITILVTVVGWFTRK